MTRALWLIISCLLLNDKLKSKTAIGKLTSESKPSISIVASGRGQGAARRRKIEGNRNDEKMKKKINEGKRGRRKMEEGREKGNKGEEKMRIKGEKGK